VKRTVFYIFAAAILFCSCGDYNALLKSQDYNYRYEAAKQAYAAGQYTKCYQLISDMLLMLKGTDRAEESLMLLGMSHFNLHDYETSTLYFDRYVKSYPKGTFTELARFYSARSSFLQSPDPRLDQTPTYTAINSLKQFLDLYPYSTHKEEASDMLFQLQDRLVQKEYEAAQLYYNLGSYTGNCYSGGSNYEAAIITAENALKSYPYTNLREDLYMLILRSRFELAQNSVEEKAAERYRNTVEEFYGFRNEYPNSKYMNEANKIFTRSNAKLTKTGAADTATN